MSERAITFECQGETLLGILHEPAGRHNSVGVLIVVGGPQYRVGSHRQFVLTARGLAAAGYPVLRFDYRGMGDATGHARGFEAVNDDVRSAVDALHAAMPAIREVMIFGLCDAASAAMMYCATDTRVRRLVLANPWVRSDAGAARATIEQYYGRRLLQRSFWAKTFSGKLQLFRSIRDFAAALLRIARGRSRSEEPGPGMDYIERMRRGFAQFSGRTLVLMSGRDLTAQEFRTLCRTSRDWRELLARPGVEWVELPDADHTFSNSADLGEAIRTVLKSLARNSPA